jgi:putative oxidoreductase
MDLALLLVRLVLGLGIAAHGAQKLFGWFEGPGLKGLGGHLEGIGLRPGRLFALAGGVGEFFGGLLIVLGLFGALGPALVVAVMVTAIALFHAPNGFFTVKNGWELPSIYIAGALALAFVGFGAYSFDAALRLSILTTPAQTWITLAIAVLAGLGNLAVRRLARASAQPQSPAKAA